MPATTYHVDRYDGTEYATLAEAQEAVRQTEGWDDCVESVGYCVCVREGARGSVYAVSCYETQAECDADQDGAHAPRIYVVVGDGAWAMGALDDGAQAVRS